MYRINILLCFLWAMPFGAFAQLSPGKFDLDLELEHRQGRAYKEEKYYKHGKLDSVYRKWDVATGQKLTEGYYIEGKRHGEWTEWLSYFEKQYYLRYTYSRGKLKKLYQYFGWANAQKDSIKSREYHYIFEPDGKNYTAHKISWNKKLGGKKTNVLLL
ncbi:hypothetical protein [uncultured Microscilla sp.]|uniref:hypothetical protein n=1 Tax=uncultured Microscilla sp. TaxID=432653 RepID=UPI0026117688|nr:hypothetical protein [uncultured Microscilla sp.]